MSVFAKARAGLYLPPAARAFLKAVETCVAAGAVAAIPIAIQVLSGSSINWRVEIPVIASAFAVAFLLTAYKFLQAVGGSPSTPQGTPLVASSAVLIPGLSAPLATPAPSPVQPVAAAETPLSPPTPQPS